MLYSCKQLLLLINREIFSLPGHNCVRERWIKLTLAQICLYWISISLQCFLQTNPKCSATIFKLISNALKWKLDIFLIKVQTDVHSFSLQTKQLFSHSNNQPHPHSHDWGNYQEHLCTVFSALYIDFPCTACLIKSKASNKKLHSHTFVECCDVSCSCLEWHPNWVLAVCGTWNDMHIMKPICIISNV